MVPRLFVFAIVLLRISCSSGSQWRELDEFQRMYGEYTRTAQEVVTTMDQLIVRTTENATKFIYDLDQTDYIRPDINLKHDCWQVFQKLNGQIQSFKIELINLETPLIKRKLEIKERLVDISNSIELYQKLTDNSYQSCMLYYQFTACKNTASHWLKTKLSSLRCRILTDCNPINVNHTVTKRNAENSTCEEDMFSCNDGTCIEKSKYCNGKEDCSDNSDEPQGCLRPCLGDFECMNQHCVSKFKICNGHDDCGDNSDEKNCPPYRYTTANCSVESGRFLCADKRCVPLEDVCNNKDDCKDGSDEGGRCGQYNQCMRGCTASGGVCFMGPQGAMCLSGCPQGLTEVSGICKRGPERPADNLEQLLETVSDLQDRYIGAVGYLKKKVMSGLQRALRVCKPSDPIESIDVA